MCLTPQQLTQQYDVIISGQHCLVHAGKSVFESTCYSYEGLTIADRGNLENKYNHHNEKLGGYESKQPRARTFFGHSTDGACCLVVVEGDADATGKPGVNGMTLKIAARLMCDLGCDFAINMDGGRPTQMRVASEGGPSTPGRLRTPIQLAVLSVHIRSMNVITQSTKKQATVCRLLFRFTVKLLQLL